MVVFTTALLLFLGGRGVANPHPMVQTYRLRIVEPSHLDVINSVDFAPEKSTPIHEVHVKGHVHGGIWINVIDGDGKLLLLKRADTLRTCPNTWGLVGEHQIADENFAQLAIRAIREELGDALLPFVPRGAIQSEEGAPRPRRVVRRRGSPRREVAGDADGGRRDLLHARRLLDGRLRDGKRVDLVRERRRRPRPRIP